MSIMKCFMDLPFLINLQLAHGFVSGCTNELTKEIQRQSYLSMILTSLQMEFLHRLVVNSESMQFKALQITFMTIDIKIAVG